MSFTIDETEEDVLRLRIRPGVLVIPDDESELARLAVGQRIVRAVGYGAVRVLRLLDGSRTLTQLQAELAGELDEDEVDEAVQSLQAYGLVEPVDPAGVAAPGVEPTAQMRAFNDLGHDGALLSAALASGRVTVLGGGAVAQAVAAAVQRFDVGTVHCVAPDLLSATDLDGVELPAADMIVAAPDPFDPEYLDVLNRLALQRDLPWLPVQVSGFVVRLGPFVHPHESACWTCYERRVESNLVHYDDHRAVRAALASGDARMPPADNLVPGVVEVAAGLAALEVVRFLASRASLLGPVLSGKTLEYGLLTLKGTFHSVLKLPRCPACGARARGLPPVRPWMQPHAELARI